MYAIINKVKCFFFTDFINELFCFSDQYCINQGIDSRDPENQVNSNNVTLELQKSV